MNTTMNEASEVCVPMNPSWDSSIREAAQSSLRSAHHLCRYIAGGGSTCELSLVARSAITEFRIFLSLLDGSSPTHRRRIRKGPLLSSPEVDPAELMGIHDLPSDVICSSPKPGHWLYQQPQARQLHQRYSETDIVAAPKKPLLRLDASTDQNLMVASTRLVLSSPSADVGSVCKQLLSCYYTSSVQRSADDSSVLSSKRKHGGCEAGIRCTASAGGCHCSKGRRLRMKRSIRVPAVGSKLAEIPSDDFSWRKYGQKPIKGSPYPRSYYKCSSMRGCPARKHVERSLDDSNMLVVTYEGDHHHPRLTFAVPSTATPH